MNTCEICGGANGQAVNTHHRQPRGMGGTAGAAADAVNSPAALIRVCAFDHNRVESYREWSRRHGYLVPRPTDPATVPARLRTVNGAAWWLLTHEGMYSWVDRPETWSACA